MNCQGKDHFFVIVKMSQVQKQNKIIYELGCTS
jgi:hypothetical protein